MEGQERKQTEVAGRKQVSLLVDSIEFYKETMSQNLKKETFLKLLLLSNTDHCVITAGGGLRTLRCLRGGS